MIIKNATQVGNQIIRTVSKAVPKKVLVNKGYKAKPDISKIIKDLTDSMRYHNLVGMAAPQIGKNVRIFVSEIRQTKLRKNQSVKNIDGLRVYINPVITWRSNKMTPGFEGCGSVAFANLFGIVKRPKSVIVEAYDEKGVKFTLKAENLLARVIQHEVDHLNGKLFVDISDSKTFMSRDEYLKKFSKNSKKGERIKKA